MDNPVAGVEYALMQDAFDEWYTETYPGEVVEPLKHLAEIAFCTAWIMAMERYSSVVANRSAALVKEAIAELRADVCPTCDEPCKVDSVDKSVCCGARM